MAARQYLVSEATKREIQRAIKKLDKIHGPHVRNTRDDIFIGSPPQKPGGGGGGNRGRLFSILSGLQDGSNFRWTYTATEVRATSFSDPFAYELINSDDTVTMVNTIEIDNTASTSAIQSGIDLSDPDITGITAIPSGTIVTSDTVRYLEGGEIWYFTLRNVPTIDCDAP